MMDTLSPLIPVLCQVCGYETNRSFSVPICTHCGKTICEAIDRERAMDLSARKAIRAEMERKYEKRVHD